MLEPDTADPIYPLDVYRAFFTIRGPIQEVEAYMAPSCQAPGRHSPHEIQVYLVCRPDSQRLESTRLEM